MQKKKKGKTFEKNRNLKLEKVVENWKKRDSHVTVDE